MKFYFYAFMATVLLFALQSCSEDASFDSASAEKQAQVKNNDKYGDAAAAERRAKTIRELKESGMDKQRLKMALKAINQDQKAIRKQMIEDLKAEGIDPDEILLSSLEELLSKIDRSDVSENKGKETKSSSISQCAAARSGRLPRLRYNFNILTSADYITLKQINYQLNGSYNYCNVDHYMYSGGFSENDAYSFTAIAESGNRNASGAEDFLDYNDGVVIRDAILNDCR